MLRWHFSEFLERYFPPLPLPLDKNISLENEITYSTRTVAAEGEKGDIWGPLVYCEIGLVKMGKIEFF